MMEEWLQIRERVLREGVSKRQILRETGMHWTTLERILSHPIPPGYCRKKLISSKIDPYWERIRTILEQDRSMPKKQRHTAKRIWEILQADGFDGGYSAVPTTFSSSSLSALSTSLDAWVLSILAIASYAIGWNSLNG